MSTKPGLRPLDYQILCKVLSREAERQISIMNNKKSIKSDISNASVFLKDIIRLYNYFAPKRDATNNSFYAKILHFFHKFIK